ATFSLPQPVGTQIPDLPSYQLASIGTYDSETTGALGRDPFGRTSESRPPVAFPAVNRRLKGDLLVDRPHGHEAPPADGTRDLTPGRVKTVSFPKPSDVHPEVPLEAPSRSAQYDTEDQGKAAVRLGRLY